MWRTVCETEYSSVRNQQRRKVHWVKYLNAKFSWHSTSAIPAPVPWPAYTNLTSDAEIRKPKYSGKHRVLMVFPWLNLKMVKSSLIENVPFYSTKVWYSQQVIFSWQKSIAPSILKKGPYSIRANCSSVNQVPMASRLLAYVTALCVTHWGNAVLVRCVISGPFSTNVNSSNTSCLMS